jgi:hypothetical protein
MTRSRRNRLAVGSLTTGVPETARKKSARRCRIGAEVCVAGVRGRPRGAPQGKGTATMKLTTMTQVTVDGAMQGNGGASDEDRRNGFERGGWALRKGDDETRTFITQTYQRAEAFLFGRRTYELFAGLLGINRLDARTSHRRGLERGPQVRCLDHAHRAALGAGGSAVVRRRPARASRRHRRRAAPADFHLLSPGARDGDPRGADAARGRRSAPTCYADSAAVRKHARRTTKPSSWRATPPRPPT